MRIIDSRVLSTSGRLGSSACLALLLLLGSGCAVITPPKVNPYSTLLPAGSKVVDVAASLPAANLKQETAYLVVGSNFVTYIDVWTKFQKSTEESSGNFVHSKATMLEGMAQWSPTRTTAIVVAGLQKHFRNIVAVNDLAEAQAKKAKWIVMFDHAHVEPTNMTAAWTDSTAIDLLDGNVRRVVAAASSEHKEYGAAWNDGDVERFMKNRGEDVLRSVRAALVQFDAKVAASR